MRKGLVILLLCAIVVVVVAAGGESHQAAAVLADDPVSDVRSRSAWEVWASFGCVIATFVGLLGIVAAHQTALRGSRVGTYRRYERELLRRGAFDLQALLDYHSLYHWGDYAAVTLGMVLVSVTLIAVDGDKFTGPMHVVQMTAIFTMIAAAVLLVFADLLHTNSQTPIVPPESRFRLIDWSVRLGTLGSLVTVLAALFFLVIIDTWLTVAGCGFFLGVMLLVYQVRRVQKAEVAAYFRLDLDGEGWPEAADRELAGRARFKDDFAGFDSASLPHRRAPEEAHRGFREALVRRARQLEELPTSCRQVPRKDDRGVPIRPQLPTWFEEERVRWRLSRREAVLALLEVEGERSEGV